MKKCGTYVLAMLILSSLGAAQVFAQRQSDRYYTTSSAGQARAQSNYNYNQAQQQRSYNNRR